MLFLFHGTSSEAVVKRDNVAIPSFFSRHNKDRTAATSIQIPLKASKQLLRNDKPQIKFPLTILMPERAIKAARHQSYAKRARKAATSFVPYVGLIAFKTPKMQPLSIKTPGVWKIFKLDNTMKVKLGI